MTYPFPPPAPIYAAAIPQRRTNGYAIAALVLGIVWLYGIGSILAIIFGHIAVNQASKDPSIAGKGMAIAGLVLGYVGIALTVLVFVLIVVGLAIGRSAYQGTGA